MTDKVLGFKEKEGTRVIDAITDEKLYVFSPSAKVSVVSKFEHDTFILKAVNEITKKNKEIKQLTHLKNLYYKLLKESREANEKEMVKMTCECVRFGYWLVNAPNKQHFSEQWIRQKYAQFRKEEKSQEANIPYGAQVKE